MKPKVLVARRLTPNMEAEAARRFDLINAGEDDLDHATTLAMLASTGAPAMLFSTNVRLDAATIATLPATLKMAATVSVGFDHVDVEAARAHGLAITNTPNVLDDCTADYAFMMLLMAARQVKAHMAFAHDWRKGLMLDDLLGSRVSGKALGIVGMGRIGRAVARRARGFGMQIHYTNLTRLPAEAEDGATYHADLTAMLGMVDFLSLHAPPLPNGGALIDAAALARMRRGAVLVNAARGSLVDETALLAALDTGQLAAAGLDVFAQEPSPNPKILAHPRVVATPHMASATEETRDAMGLRAIDNVSAFFAGATMPDLLTA